ncbi:MAG: hypothetical protein JRI59_10910 [Deltaproteobacteria bacterium]|nr:hypothetical protein [Deltaproteobacteria bacterium]
MEDDLEKALQSLTVQIKREIIENYFAERVYLEEELEYLDEQVRDYQQEYAKLRRTFWAFYQALGSEPAIAAVMRVLDLQDWPAYQEFLKLPEAERRRLLAGRRPFGLTAFRRHRRLVFDLYEELLKQMEPLRAHYSKIVNRLRLINEDIQKFNSSFDFGLIAAQVEAMEGGGQVISGGLQAAEREELSTRMRFKRKKLTEEELPPVPDLPPLNQVKTRLSQVLSEFYG